MQLPKKQLKINEIKIIFYSFVRMRQQPGNSLDEYLVDNNKKLKTINLFKSISGENLLLDEKKRLSQDL